MRARLTSWPLIPDADDAFAYEMGAVPASPWPSSPASALLSSASSATSANPSVGPALLPADAFARYRPASHAELLVNPHAAQFQRRAGEVQ